MLSVWRVCRRELTPRGIGGERFQDLESRLFLQIQLRNARISAESRKDNPLALGGDVQLRVIALAGRYLHRLTAHGGDLPYVHRSAAAPSEINELPIR